MRAVVQRVKEARVEVEGRTVGEIGPGLLVLLGVGEDDFLTSKVQSGEVIRTRRRGPARRA